MAKHGLTGMGLAVLPLFMVGVLSRGLIEKLMPRWLVYLGDISFSLYLTHVIILSMVKAMLAPFIGEGHLLMTAAVLVSIAVGALYFFIIERPISKLLTSLFKGRRSRIMNALT